MVCPQGNDWQNERKAVCLIETEDGGNASGALMMNTCNTVKPYILTAWHVTEGRNTNNWTFLFGWWSSTCIPNTNVSQSILFNGAILRATFEPTDFSLIELNQTPTANLNLSFLGWDRQNNIPASTTGIHHPKGDQMKISFDTDPAAIGNVRLNSNTAWRVVWKSGITEKGSSGSPLFDQNHRVVGQNFSGTQPTYQPCNQQTGGNNYGRFDLSWTGGGTNSTRLSNWLDPNGIGVLTTNTNNISTLVSSTGGSLSILGDGIICSGTKTYTLKNNGIPYNGNVTWTSSNPNIASITPNSNPAILTRVNNGIVTITASVGCGITETKEVNVNVPDINYSSFLVSGPSCLSGTGAMSFGVNYNGTSGCGLNNYNITEVEWQVFCSNPHQVTNNAGAYACSGINKAGIRVTFFQPIVQPFVITFLYRLKNSCGWSEWSTGNYHLIQPCSGSWSFTTSPNPTEGTITVALDGQTSQNKNATMREIQVMDKFGKIVKRFEFDLGKKSTTVNLNDLKGDIYFIKVFDGKEWKVQSVIKY